MSRLSVSVAPCPRIWGRGCRVDGVYGRGSSMEALEGVASLLSSVPSLSSPYEKEGFSVGSCRMLASLNSLGEGRKTCFFTRLLPLLLSLRDCRWELLSLTNSGSAYSFSTVSFTDSSSLKLYQTTTTSCRRFIDGAGRVFSARVAQISALMAVWEYEAGCSLFRISWETRQAPIDLQLIEQFVILEYFRSEIRKRPQKTLRSLMDGVLSVGLVRAVQQCSFRRNCWSVIYAIFQPILPWAVAINLRFWNMRLKDRVEVLVGVVHWFLRLSCWKWGWEKLWWILVVILMVMWVEDKWIKLQVE